MVTYAQMTAEQLLKNPVPNKRTELVRGQLIVREPAGIPHGVVAAKFLIAIGQYVTATKAGMVVAAETGFTLQRAPDTVRAPDVAFLSHERIAGRVLRGFAEIAPDFVVEVLSPDDRAGEVRAKISDWIAAGTFLVWVVDPVRRRARIYRADGSETVVSEHESLSGEVVLPGLKVLLSEMLL